MCTSAELLPAALDRFERVVADVGCGDGKYALRIAQREPEHLVVGIDSETTRLDRTLATVRKRRIANLLFLAWSMEAPLPALTQRVDDIHVVMPWGSLLDGVLGGDDAVLTHVLALGRSGAAFAATINCRPWDAAASVDAKLAATPIPTEDTLQKLPELYETHGWRLGEPRWLSDDEARSMGSSWVSRVVSSRRAMLLRISAVKDA
jgi:16S rRNA (adenine(1408)-N(1))-methyltransferase